MDNKKTQITDVVQTPQFLANIALGHLQSMSKFACLAIQGAFLLNSAVGIGAYVKLAQGIAPLIACSIGALLAVIAAGFAWKAQILCEKFDGAYFLKSLKTQPDQKLNDRITHLHALAERYASACILLWAFSLVSFVVALIIFLIL